MIRKLLILATLLFSLEAAAHGDCYKAAIIDPPTFMGNSDEYVQLFDGSVWEIELSREMLGAEYPMATICPSQRLMIVNGVKFRVNPVLPD